ncbi:sensor histidine kinase [Shewanella intestini]|uniref:histidine kinase n=1 Tax=Shewanella intestini TaxID=2017544 RepID=A0ABS5I1Z7_9GAMM|nr:MULTISPECIES: HAMP domain-containing sensor histidine kinase [Shewanella]MBR9727926.1 HAMP domain-containing histidine kinase [Shewanella intestini]MRG36523.1 hypothetical protein [Shewanella sp. XMDDZSB0408]
MKKKFIRLFLLTIFTLLSIAFITESIFLTANNKPTNDVDMAQVMSAIINVDHDSPQINNVQILDVNALAWPANLLQRLQNGEILQLQEGLEQVYFYQVLAKHPSKVMQVGPLNVSAGEEQGILLPVIFYSSFALFLLFWFWPLFRDLELLSLSTANFSREKHYTAPNIKKSSHVFPLAASFSVMSQQILKYIALQRFLSSTISHDIRTPLSRMFFHTDMLNAHNIEQTKQALFEELDEIELLTDQYLEFSKLECEKKTLKRLYQDISPLLAQIVQQSQKDTPISISWQINQQTSFYFDGFFIKRALQNVLTNAIKYAHSQVLISVQISATQVTIAVEDDGPGINATQTEQVTIEYQQGEEPKHGYGLGLTIASTICEWHQGRLEIEKSAKLKGTKITLLLPLA